MSKFNKLCETVGLEKISLDYPDNIEPFYPDFSVTAQLELWKYLLRQDLNIQYYYIDKKYGFVLAEDDENIFEYEKWEEALAALIIFLINTKRIDKSEVKELLIRWIDDWD